MLGSFWNRLTVAFRSKVISTSGLESDILNFGSRPMSAVRQAGQAWSKKWGTLFNLVAIAFRSNAISTSGLESAILNSGSRPMSNNVVSDTAGRALWKI